MDEFPPNSLHPTAKAKPEEAEKKVEPIEGLVVQRRKKPLSKKFLETFLGDEPRGVAAYVMLEVVLPAVKDLIVDAATQGIERAVFPNSRPGRVSRAIGSSRASYVSYDRFAQGRRQETREEPRRESAARAPRSSRRPRFDEIIVRTRHEGEDIISRMRDMIARYENVSVADLYSLLDISGNYIDENWGWTHLDDAGVSRVSHDQYVLNLPDPISLSKS